MDEETLLVRLHSLGDVVLASGTARAMAEAGRLTFITRPEYLPVAERIPGIISALPLNGGWMELRSMSRGFSCIVDLQNNLTTRLAFTGRKPRRFRFSRSLRKMVLKGNGESLPWRAGAYLDVWGGPGDPAPVLERRGFPPGGAVNIGIAVGGRWPLKAIPDGVVAELARLFCDITGAGVFLIGGPAERETAVAIADQCGSRDVFPEAGRGGVGELIERIERLDLLISPDSGPAHVGMALGVPTQVIFTSTSPSLGFYPEGFPGAFFVPGLSCRPCHRHGGNRCASGVTECRNMLLPREIYEEAKCLMR